MGEIVHNYRVHVMFGNKCNLGLAIRHRFLVILHFLRGDQQAPPVPLQITEYIQ